MRSEQEMFDLILSTAREDERIRAVILNGSRANPNSPRDFFQDFDIVYIVTDVNSFVSDPGWIARFGELMILQLPDEMQDPLPEERNGYAYLMQFADGNRIDLGLYPFNLLNQLPPDSQSILLLDKDGLIAPFAPASDRDYLPQPPTRKQFEDCCNEFWWVAPYVAKGLWRGELPYARAMLEDYVRPQLMKMLSWEVGVRTHYSVSQGKHGKYLERLLEPGWWQMLLDTYADSNYPQTWEALLGIAHLFRLAAIRVAQHFGFAYPEGDDRRVSAHLQHVRSLPRDAAEMYP